MVDYFRSVLEPSGGKVYVANSHPNAAGFASADGGFIVPSIYDPAYIDRLIQICHQFEIQAIIPLYDLELPILAKARNRLAAKGICAVVSSPDVINICNDKWQTMNFLESYGFHTPQTFPSIDSALDALAASEIDFPVFIKPRWGMGSIGVIEAENEIELQFIYTKVMRIIEKSPLINASVHDHERMILIQEKLSGQEYGLDVINDLQSNYVTTFIKKKIAMRYGETDIAMTVADHDLNNLGQEIAMKLRHIANLDMDVIITERGAYVLEMNPRFGGGYPFSHLAGANLPAAIISWLNDEPANPSYFEIKPNVIGCKGILPLRLVANPVESNTIISLDN
jgi:carbamoyl-phosphate synthase large subunit